MINMMLLARVPLVPVSVPVPVHVHVPVHDVVFADLVSALDPPRQHRHNPYQKVLAFAHCLPVEDPAPVENVRNSPAFPR